MKRITTLLMTAGALALAGCSGGEEGTNNAAANVAAENLSADFVTNEMDNGFNAAAEATDTSVTPPAPAAAKEEPAATKIAPAPPKAAPKAAPKADTPKAAPKTTPKAEPAPPPKAECLPEHRAAGHC